MIEVLTGVFSGVLCALIAASFGYAKSRGKKFDFWILIVGAIFSVIWVQLVANAYFTWQEWFLTVFVLALFEYGGRALMRKIGVDVKIDRESFFVQTLNLTTAIYIVLFLVVLFLWFLPFLFGERFMVYEEEYGEFVFKWFASSVPQIEREAFAAYIIFGFPLMGIFSYHVIALFRNRGKKALLGILENE